MWPRVTEVLGARGVEAELNLIEGSMTVRTTRKTRDPYIIFKSRDMIKVGLLGEGLGWVLDLGWD